MTEIPNQSLNGPKALGTLSLAHNRIRNIKQNDLANLKELRKLILTGNDIVSIEGGSFSGMNNLRAVHLSLNALTRFNSDVFTGTNITNSFENVQPFAGSLYLLFSFAGAENLEYLDLSQNYFTEYPRITLKSLPLLKYLNLSSNLIKSLSNEDVGALTRLETLDLSRNNINSFQPGTFSNLWHIKQLDLSVNSLRTVSILTKNLKGLRLKRFENHIRHSFERSPYYGCSQGWTPIDVKPKSGNWLIRWEKQLWCWLCINFLTWLWTFFFFSNWAEAENFSFAYKCITDIAKSLPNLEAKKKFLSNQKKL